MANEIKGRRGGNVRNKKVTHPRPKARRARAEARQEEYNKLTTAQKISLLDMDLGVGVGAKKQRAKLQARLATEQKMTSQKK